MDLQKEFGNIDIYLFDQLLKGRISSHISILDAGCGGGRNLVYFLRNGFEVFAIDSDPGSIERVRYLAATLAPELPPQNFVTADLVEIPFQSETFDLVISSAVLHFARDEQHFGQMLDEMWRILKPGGMLFARLASSIGIETLIRPIQGRRFSLPDGSERFLVNTEMLDAASSRLKATLLEPIKTTNVADLRCMTTWVLEKS
jgi:SAM-dependent methyltransferase